MSNGQQSLTQHQHTRALGKKEGKYSLLGLMKMGKKEVWFLKLLNIL